MSTATRLPSPIRNVSADRFPVHYTHGSRLQVPLKTQQFRQFLLRNGYATRYSTGFLPGGRLHDLGAALGGVANGPLSGILQGHKVGRHALEAALNRRYVSGFNTVAVYSLDPMSDDTAVQCVVRDIQNLSPGDRTHLISDETRIDAGAPVDDVIAPLPASTRPLAPATRSAEEIIATAHQRQFQCRGIAALDAIQGARAIRATDPTAQAQLDALLRLATASVEDMLASV